jgi:hypothetical protein
MSTVGPQSAPSTISYPAFAADDDDVFTAPANHPAFSLKSRHLNIHKQRKKTSRRDGKAMD